MIKQYLDQPRPEDQPRPDRERTHSPRAAGTASAGVEALGSGEPSDLDLGQCLMAQRDYAGALIYLERHHGGGSNPRVSEGIDSEGIDIDGAIALAVCRLHLRQPTAALQACNQVLALYPSHPQALLFKGVALHRLGRYRAAYSLYRQAVPLSHPPRWTLSRLKGHLKGMVRWSKISLRQLLWRPDTTLEG